MLPLISSLKIILLPLAAGFISQVSKFFISANNKKFKLKSIMDYSGMPSGHSALVISLATIIFLEEGLRSPVFGISVVLAILVIRDALGIRQYLSRHGRVLNILVKDLKEDEMLDYKYPHLLEKIGHTPAQVIVGGLIGFLVSLIGYWILG